MYSARYADYLLSLAGACVLSFGAGSLVADQLGDAAWLVVFAGAVMHGVGMFRSHRRHNA